MKFTYEDKKETCECVAVIWSSHLVVKCNNGYAVVFSGPDAVDGSAVYAPASRGASRGWGYYEDRAERKFYRGDKVTIEF